MVNNDIFMGSEIIYDPNKHAYTNQAGIVYKSVSRLIDSIQIPFDDHKMAGIMADYAAEKDGISVVEARKIILDDWKERKDSSIKRGDFVHDAFERFLMKGTFEPEMKKPLAYLSEMLKEYYRYYPEQIVYSHDHQVAGRTDLIMQRQKSKNPVFDLMDYKSNEAKGIVFDSVNRKNAQIKHYNKYFLPPFDHLEDCNYIRYSFQLSIYAFLAMSRLGIRIGKLGILFVDNDFEPHYYPVPFMYHEAKILCELNMTRKELPSIDNTLSPTVQINYIPRPATGVTTNQKYDLTNIREDW
jgi:hypothetical protein